MKNRIAQYSEPRKNAYVLLSFILISLFLGIIFILSINNDCIQLNSLLKSGYEYSAVMQDSVMENDYYQFSASIEFALSSDSQTRLDTEIVMQTNSSAYTDLVYWNADILSANGIAISKNLAKDCDLHIGDKLYSKHIVNGELCEYTIEQIIPAVTNITTKKNNENHQGLIIMGFDESYIDNISHNNIVFTNDTIEQLSAKGTIGNIIYREDEISDILKKMIPYILLFIVIISGITVLLVYLISKNIACNFRRLVMLGFEKRTLNRSYRSMIIRFGVIAVVSAFALSCSVWVFVDFLFIKLMFLMLLSITSCISLFVTTTVLNKRLWRK